MDKTPGGRLGNRKRVEEGCAGAKHDRKTKKEEEDFLILAKFSSPEQDFVKLQLEASPLVRHREKMQDEPVMI